MWILKFPVCFLVAVILECLENDNHILTAWLTSAEFSNWISGGRNNARTFSKLSKTNFAFSNMGVIARFPPLPRLVIRGWGKGTKASKNWVTWRVTKNGGWRRNDLVVPFFLLYCSIAFTVCVFFCMCACMLVCVCVFAWVGLWVCVGVEGEK